MSHCTYSSPLAPVGAGKRQTNCPVVVPRSSSGGTYSHASLDAKVEGLRNLSQREFSTGRTRDISSTRAHEEINLITILNSVNRHFQDECSLDLVLPVRRVALAFVVCGRETGDHFLNLEIQ
jgi:hypothetical protein